MTIEKRLRKIIRQTEQLIRDIDWWNTHRIDAPPIDCESDRVRLSLATRALAALRARRMDECGRLVDELVQ